MSRSAGTSTQDRIASTGFPQSAFGATPAPRSPVDGAGGPLLAWEPIQLLARVARRRSTATSAQSPTPTFSTPRPTTKEPTK